MVESKPCASRPARSDRTPSRCRTPIRRLRSAPLSGGSLTTGTRYGVDSRAGGWPAPRRAVEREVLQARLITEAILDRSRSRLRNPLFVLPRFPA